MSIDTELPPEVVIAIQEGHKIKAIKMLREAKGLGLKEAKDAVDAYVEQHPMLQVESSGSSGFLLFVFFILAGIAGYFLFV